MKTDSQNSEYEVSQVLVKTVLQIIIIFLLYTHDAGKCTRNLSVYIFIGGLVALVDVSFSRLKLLTRSPLSDTFEN